MLGSFVSVTREIINSSRKYCPVPPKHSPDFGLEWSPSQQSYLNTIQVIDVLQRQPHENDHSLFSFYILNFFFYISCPHKWIVEWFDYCLLVRLRKEWPMSPQKKNKLAQRNGWSLKPHFRTAERSLPLTVIEHSINYFLLKSCIMTIKD